MKGNPMVVNRSKTFLAVGIFGLVFGALACQKETGSNTESSKDSIAKTLAGEKLSNIVFSCSIPAGSEPNSTPAEAKPETALTGTPPETQGKGVVISAVRKGSNGAPIKILTLSSDSMVSISDKQLGCEDWVSGLNAFAQKKQVFLSELTLEPRLANKGGILMIGPLTNPSEDTPRFVITSEENNCIFQSFGPNCRQEDSAAKDTTPALQTYQKYLPGISTKYVKADTHVVSLGSYIQSVLGEIPQGPAGKEAIYCKFDELKSCLQASGGTACYSLNSGKAPQCQFANPGNTSKLPIDLEGIKACVERARKDTGGSTPAGKCATDNLLSGI